MFSWLYGIESCRLYYENKSKNHYLQVERSWRSILSRNEVSPIWEADQKNVSGSREGMMILLLEKVKLLSQCNIRLILVSE